MGSQRTLGDARADADQQRERDEQRCTAQDAELFDNDGKDEIAVRFVQVLRRAESEAHPADAAGADREGRIDHSRAVGCGPGVQPVVHLCGQPVVHGGEHRDADGVGDDDPAECPRTR